jgi:di/tricarboxylate transporter
MTAEAWISLGVTLGIFVALQRVRGIPPDLLFLFGLLAVTAAGVITPEEALRGFANPVVITIGALFVVAAGLKSTGALDMIGQRVLGSARDERGALARMTAPIVGMSAFLNNTPIVAMMVPIVIDWCRRRGLSPSRLLIPISYLAIIGGTCTLIGTSTNLLLNGMLAAEYQKRAEHARADSADAQQQALRHALRPMHLFEIGYVGIPSAVAGSLVLVCFAYRLLPRRLELVEQLGEQRREYLVEMLVAPECRLIGQTVEGAGLRHLPGLFLIEIDRDGDIITPVAPEDVIHAGDRLVFTGVVSTIADLEKIPGLVPAADMTYEVHPRQRQGRRLTEVVLSDSSPLCGKTVREARFRQLYNAAVVAVHRNGKRLPSKIGDIRLQPGDTLLLQTRSGFADAFRNSPDFYLVADVAGYAAVRLDRAYLALALLALLVVLFTICTLTDNAAWAGISAIAVAGLLIATRCISMNEARDAVDLQVLLTIGASLGLGLAIDRSGAAGYLARSLVDAVGQGHPWLLLAVVFVVTSALTELITNNAVAALMFPIGLAVATEGGYSPRPFVMAIAMAASASFMTPIGYQTNLMVMGPGGYQPRDYLRAGAPMELTVMVTSLLLIPIFWPLQL